MATVTDGNTHYAALYAAPDGLRVAAREGSPVIIADFLAAAVVPVESLPPSVQRRFAQAFDTQRTRFLLSLATRMPTVDVDALDATDD